MSDKEYEGWDGFTSKGERSRFSVTRYHGNISGWVVFLRLGDEQDWTFDPDEAEGFGRELIAMADEVRAMNKTPGEPIA